MVAPSARTPELVLFDLDDTIMDHSLTCRRAIAAIRREYPRLQRRPLDALWQDYLRALDADSSGLAASPSAYARLRAERFRRLAASCRWEIARSTAGEISRRYRAEYQVNRRAVPGAVELVRRVARLGRVGVVTNNEYREQEEKLRFLGLEGVIDPMVVSAREGVAKPDPRIFRIALDRAGVRPEDAVMVGDSWSNDVLGARGAGIHAVWFNRFERPRPSRHRAVELRKFVPLTAAEMGLRLPDRRGPRSKGTRA